MSHSILRHGGLAAVLGAAMVQPAGAVEQLAQAAPAPAAAAPAAPAVPAGFWDSFTVGAEAELGITANPDDNASGVNYGHLFTDRENQLLLNQLTLTAARPVASGATGFDWGFRLQGLYGTDARYTHFLGELDTSIKERAQLDVLEASVSAHLPWLSAGGIDAKAGQFPTPVGYEVIEPAGNPFYSHSYIFNFGIPLKHTGGYGTWHVDDTVDLWGGVDSGVNTSLGDGDNNDAASFLAGFGLNNLMGGKLTILALSHIGPENPTILAGSVPFNPNTALRFLNDAVITYKWNNSLTLTTELNYIRDDGFHANGWGIAQYAAYTLSDTLTLNGRGEIYHDGGQNGSGFFVAGFPHNLDFVYAEEGLPNTSFNFGHATYTEWTVGLTIKPAVPDMVKGLMIRPELRVDSTLDGVKAYHDGDSTSQFTAAVDVVIPVTLF